ncbi:MAG: glutamate--tRNA ligase [Holosporales bacterium]|jgi:glutamyl-tRNA synthetase|nr:glutamate--tRNA ligase [Holosporales bacterium]
MNCKVRFAPSPTGYMHIGNARIAIINYLFCKKNKGHFLFRLDDTDTQRSQEIYEQSIVKDLSWLGIFYDSTFKQSSRFGRYDEIKNKLIEKGSIYPCYETEEELEYKRRLAITKGKPPIYDRSSLSSSNYPVTADSPPVYYRFKLPDQTITWNDLVFGKISYDLKNVSDPIIIKADGTYLYTFSSIIDDFDYNITHIIRGQDHITNTAVQLAILNEISENKPINIEFAHLSLLINKDGSQFSKRLGSLNLGDLQKKEILPITIINMMATLGSSIDTIPFTSVDKVIENFELSKFSSNSPKFSIDELFLLNKKVLHNYSYEEIDFDIDRNVFDLVHQNVEKMSDLEMWKNIFLEDFRSDYVPQNENEKKVIKTTLELLDIHILDNLLDKLKSATGISGKDLYMPLRLALTGIEHGPNIVNIIKILGVPQVKTRLQNYI